MIYIKPLNLSYNALSPDELKKDKKALSRFFRSGVGEQALYVSLCSLDRLAYINVSDIERVFKRVAMSKGAYTGKGMFASIAYLVVVYRNKNNQLSERQVYFKDENDVNDILSCIKSRFPQIPIGKK